MKASDSTGVTFHSFECFEAQSVLTAGCTYRWGGVSKPPYEDLNLGLHVGDDRDAVLENRKRVAHAVGEPLESFVLPQQVHRGNASVATLADRGRGALAVDDAVPETDALI